MGLSQLIFEHPTFRLWCQRFNPLHHRRGLCVYAVFIYFLLIAYKLLPGISIFDLLLFSIRLCVMNYMFTICVKLRIKDLFYNCYSCQLSVVLYWQCRFGIWFKYFFIWCSTKIYCTYIMADVVFVTVLCQVRLNGISFIIIWNLIFSEEGLLRFFLCLSI